MRQLPTTFTNAWTLAQVTRFCSVGHLHIIQLEYDWKNTPLYLLPSLHNLVTYCFIYWLVDISYFLSFQLILNSMHKYQPRVHIIRKRDHTASVINLKSEEMKTFTFPETNFIGVTAYQNQLVSQFSRCAVLNRTCFQLEVYNNNFQLFGSLWETDE